MSTQKSQTVTESPPVIPQTMKAAVLFGPGDMRVVDDKAVPKPGPSEVLMRVVACGMCGTDIKIYHGKFPNTPPFGEFTPGHEFTGEVVALGDNVTEFSIGDKVVCEAHKGCGQCDNCIDGEYTACLNYGDLSKGHRASGMSCDGGFAEYAVAHINQTYKIPEKVSLDEAAIAVTSGTSLYAMDRIGGFLSGRSVAIIGPGPVGLVLVQVAKALGASKVILVGTRENRLELGREFGADEIVHISREDNPVDQVLDLTDGEGVNFTFECAGGDNSADHAIGMTRKAGTVVIVAFYNETISLNLNNAIRNRIDIKTMRGEGRQVLRRAVTLQEQGKIDAGPIITHRFPLDEITDAFETFETRHGNPVKILIKP